MDILLVASRLVDSLNTLVGRYVRWLILAAVLISAGNAIVRKLFQTSSNALLEIQWYLFAAVFLFARAMPCCATSMSASISFVTLSAGPVLDRDAGLVCFALALCCC